MALHEMTIIWRNTREDFSYPAYDRTHSWVNGGGMKLEASAAPAYRGDHRLINPEEAFVGALSSCHMLTFLALASVRKLVVESYEDHASGTLAGNNVGRMVMTSVVLRPKVLFRGAVQPPPEIIFALHKQSHEECFIAQSVSTEVTIEMH